MTRMFALALVVTAALVASLLPTVSVGEICHTTPYIRTVVETPTIVQATPAVAVPVPVLVPAVSFQFIPAVTAALQSAQAAPAAQATQSAAVQPAATAANKEMQEARATMRNFLTSSEQTSRATKASATKDSGVLTQVAELIKTKCASCHTGPSGKGGVTLFNEANDFAPNVGRDTLWYITKNNRMPPNADKNPGTRVNRSGLDLLKAWMLEEETAEVE